MGEPFAIGRGSDPPERREHPPMPPGLSAGSYSMCANCPDAGCGEPCPWAIVERARPRPGLVLAPDNIDTARVGAWRRFVARVRWLAGKD